MPARAANGLLAWGPAQSGEMITARTQGALTGTVPVGPLSGVGVQVRLDGLGCHAEPGQDPGAAVDGQDSQRDVLAADGVRVEGRAHRMRRVATWQLLSA